LGKQSINISNGVSVVICCFNSAWVLERTLEALASQTAPFEWELTVVDNMSTDQTKDIFARFQNANPALDSSLVTETQQGLSYARIAGYQKAKHDILVYCDDDTLLAPDYLDTASHFMTNNPGVGLCGGLGNPIFETEPDPRILPFIAYYATGPQGSSPIEDITAKGFVYGAGMVVRRNIITDLLANGFQFLTTGRKGNVLTGGEDVEFGNAVKMAGHRIFYNENLMYDHILPSKRLTWSYLLRMAYGAGYSSAVIFSPSRLFSFKSNPFYTLCLNYYRIIKRVLLIYSGRASLENQVKVAFFRGIVACLHSDFRDVFEKRRIAQAFYRGLSGDTNQ
jgi:glycosyltransferase involved in cell wall biosynthesis